MRNKFILFMLALSVVLGAAAQGKVRIACVGNSITEGYALAHPETESYPAVLQRMLGDGYEVGNFGLSAHTLMMKGNLPYMSKQRYKDALDFAPDVVTIMLGTNDTKPENWAHKDDFQADLRTMVDAFQALPSHPKVYLCLPVPAEHKEWGISDSVMTYGVIPRIKEVARERHLPVIDLNTLLRPYHPWAYTDGVHPDRRGAAVIAAGIYRALTGREPDPLAAGRTDLALWYDGPARQWEETLPLGNGWLGMMPDGALRANMSCSTKSACGAARRPTTAMRRLHAACPRYDACSSRARTRRRRSLCTAVLCRARPATAALTAPSRCWPTWT